VTRVLLVEEHGKGKCRSDVAVLPSRVVLERRAGLETPEHELDNDKNNAGGSGERGKVR